MLSMKRITVEGLENGCVTDEPNPGISFSLTSDQPDTQLVSARIRIGDWESETQQQINVAYRGAPLRPMTACDVRITAKDNHGETAEGRARFETGRLKRPWEAKWITDGAYTFGKTESPAPMTFRRRFRLRGEVRRTVAYATALGIYELSLNGDRVGDRYFAPGFTAYEHRIQYQTYDLMNRLSRDNGLVAVVAGGWACGFFNYVRKNKISADRQALLMEIRVTYRDGTEETIASDSDWEVTTEGSYRFAEFYDGEAYDAIVDLTRAPWHPAAVTAPRGAPALTAECGSPVRVRETLAPVSVTAAKSGETIYDFGQNFTGVVQSVRWGGKSNFVDIPTDCPQRDERQDWTGDIAVFASAACYLFDTGRFFDKRLGGL